MKHNTCPTGQHTQWIEVTEEMIEALTDAILSRMLSCFHGSQTAMYLEISGRRLISDGIARALQNQKGRPGKNKVKAIS